MRAAYNTTATLFDGPGTATPGFPRVVDAPCRVVPDFAFRGTEGLDADALVYLTLDAGAPQGPTAVDTGGGLWLFDYTQADRVAVASYTWLAWIAVRTEFRTWPTPPGLYYRAHLIPDGTPLTECQLRYQEAYTINDPTAPGTFTVNRTGPTTWTGSGYTLTAENTPMEPNCVSEWRVTLFGLLWKAKYNGQTWGKHFVDTTGPLPDVIVNPVP